NNWLDTTLTTGAITANHHHRGGAELAYQSGPFAVRSEAFFAKYGGNVDKTATGASVELTYFLTGDWREYSLANGNFGAAKVRKPFHPFKCGEWNLVDSLGAWQFVTQYGYVDLGDWRATTGGRQHDLTFGLNWFWTSNLRWIFEYTHSQQNTGTAYTYTYQDIFGTSVRMNW
ncbi:MAG: hypothetical protein LBH00_10880, partial [Planctomycetaceae bacterium]|nr:hypothetical protein [Planctomycetaceae bacterium]